MCLSQSCPVCPVEAQCTKLTGSADCLCRFLVACPIGQEAPCADCPASSPFCVLSAGACMCSALPPGMGTTKKRRVEEIAAGVCECPSSDSAAGLGRGATIGIAVGGAIAGLLVVALVAWLALRSRRQQATVAAPSDVEMVAPSAGIYGKIDVPAERYGAAPMIADSVVANAYDRVEMAEPQENVYTKAPAMPEQQHLYTRAPAMSK